MKQFSILFENLVHANDSKSKQALLTDFWKSAATASEQDHVLQLLLGQYPKRTIATKKITEWTSEITGFHDWLIQRSEEEVGDPIQTFNLLLRANNISQHKRTLSDWLMEIGRLKSEMSVKSWLKEKIMCVDEWQRLILLKLLTGTFKSPVTKPEIVGSLADYVKLKPEVVFLRLFEIKQKHQSSLSAISISLENEHENTPYPFPDIKEVETIQDITWSNKWLVFGKKNGLEVQVTKCGNTTHIWSRSGELWSDKFPEIISALSTTNSDFKLYGQLTTKNPNISIEHLKSRLNKKRITKNDLAKAQTFIEVFEILEGDLIQMPEIDLRHISMAKTIMYSSKDELFEIHKKCRELGFTGLCLKSTNNPQYFHWKADRFSVNAVLTYVEFGGLENGGIRSLTFGARHQEEFLPVAKISVIDSHLDIQEILQFVKENTLERFGPVRTVKPELVYEILFDGIARSSRRKSGFILTNPKIIKKIGSNLMSVDDINYLKGLLSTGKD